MQSQHLATTRLRDVVAAGVGGQSVVEQHAVLQQLLRRELSDRHAALLSEPVANTASGEVDWYAPGASPAVRLDQLGPYDAAGVRADLDALLADCAALAERLRGSRNPSDALLGTTLAAALQVPGDASVHVLDGRPVLSGWGHARAGRAASSVVLTAEGGDGGRMAILPPPAAPRPAGLPRWVPALAAALLLLVPLLAAALLYWDPMRWLEARAAPCRPAPGQAALLAALQDEEARGAALRTELGRLVADAGERRLQCPVPPAPRAAAPPPPPSADAERAQRAGGGAGKLQIILAWDDVNDLDLHVICPGNERLFHNRRRACDGALDVDANGDSRATTRAPVENATWPQPRPGSYRVFVDPYDMRAGARTPFRLTVRQEGQPDRVVEGVAARGQGMAPVTQVEVTP